MKVLIGLFFVCVVLAGATPYALDKYVGKKVAEKIVEFSNEEKKKDPTLSITHGEIHYDVFDDLVTVENISYYSIEKGFEVTVKKVITTPVDTEDFSDISNYFESIPKLAITNIEGGKINVRKSKLTDDMAMKVYSYFAGEDGDIEFSSNSKGVFITDLGEYEYSNSTHIENLGELEVLVGVNGIPTAGGDKQLNDMPEMLKDMKVEEFGISFSTTHTKAILNELFDVLSHVDSEKEVVKELNKLAGKMKADETLKGFAQPILDIAKSYQSQRKLTLELKTNEAIDIEKAMMAITMAAMGAGTPSEIANHLQIKLESRLD
tara:strand:+ start:197 stop:1156 length:960 start_codon:yes stop_codon:yes gene_type:complete